MINNFFQNALQIDKFASDFYTEKLQKVYDYIEKYWKKSKSDLATGTFDLEECFTIIELQLDEALTEGDSTRIQNLREIQYKLKLFLAEVLSEFCHQVFTSQTLREFACRLLKERPIIITFNYDDFLENALETFSGINTNSAAIHSYFKRQDELKSKPFDQRSNGTFNIPEEELGYNYHNWTRSLGYGIKFDFVRRHFPGDLIDGRIYYSHPNNKLYKWYMLKLHGSLEWFRYLPIRVFPGEQIPLFGEKGKQIILDRASYWFTYSPTLEGWYIDPILVTPTLYKEKQLTEGVYTKLALLWSKARDALSSCKKLVVIGYSFPDTDFMTKKLFLESFADNQLDKLIIVNPDNSVAPRVANLCHHSGPITVWKNLVEFIRSE
jgi:hypothetical protein